METAIKLASFGGTAGLVLGYAVAPASAQPAPAICCAVVGVAIGFGLAFVMRLGRIGHKALKKIERKLDE